MLLYHVQDKTWPNLNTRKILKSGNSLYWPVYLGINIEYYQVFVNIDSYQNRLQSKL
jgi:hypothetical protein